MDHTHQFIKYNKPKDAAAKALEALKADPESRRKVEVAENTSRLLVKQKVDPSSYNQHAKSVFPHSTFFKGEK